MLNAGRLRHRITLQTPVEVQNQDTGAVEVTWVDVATVWAAIEPLSVREMVTSSTEMSKVKTRITIRYRDDVNYTMRAYHQSKGLYYNIEGPLSDKDSGLEYLTLPCSEGMRYLDEN